jgi:hypothetical protein
MGMQRGGDEANGDEKKLRELEDRRWKLQAELWDMNKPVEAVPPEPVPAPNP